MGANLWGECFQVTSFGESHGSALGAVIDGCPAGVSFDFDLLRAEMNRRRPGSTQAGGAAVSQRQEQDEVEILSGVYQGKTLGTPIAMLVRNQDARSSDYDGLKDQARIGHADDVWQTKFGHRDHRGGGRSSGRETVARVMAGAVARMLIREMAPGLQIRGFATAIGPFILSEEERTKFLASDQSADQFSARFPSARHEDVKAALDQVRAEYDSWGGIAEIQVRGAPAGLGQPVFHKLKSDLARAMLSVGASSGFEMGDGLHNSQLTGRRFHTDSQNSRYGGVRGGISTGEDLSFRTHFKPTSSLLDVAKQGRHDPCIVIRALPVLEAMTALVLADHLLWRRRDRI